MFEYCPMTDEITDEPVLFCGASTGYETRVSPLPECWLNMKPAMRTKYRKQKRAEYEALNPKKLDYKVIGTKRYKKSY